MIGIAELTKRYGKLIAVDRVSLEVREGECFALLGLNGAGKTTLIDMLSTQVKPSGGNATICGYDLLSQTKEIRKIVNISPQESAFAGNLTVRENLKLIADLYDLDRKEERIADAIGTFGLKEKENTRCKKLSGGQQRRLSIALALLTEPKVLFLDEPTLGLDVKGRRKLWEIVEGLKGKITIFLTTHYLEEVEYLADRAAVIAKGKIRAVGTVADLKEQAGKPTLEEAFLSLTGEEEE